MSLAFGFQIIGAGRGGTSLLMALLNAHPRCEVRSEEFSTKFLMGQQWTPAELESDPAKRIRLRIDNYLNACEHTAAQFPDIVWGHKTTTEHIAGLGIMHPSSRFAGDPEALPETKGIDPLEVFVDRTATIRTIFILRDGRSCVRSKVARTGMSIEEAVRRWKYSVRALGAMCRRTEAFHRIKMEDLVRYPEATLQSVCEFLGLRYSPVMLSGTQSPHTLPEYRRSGFDLSTIDVSAINDLWVAEIHEELTTCGYDVAPSS